MRHVPTLWLASAALVVSIILSQAHASGSAVPRIPPEVLDEQLRPLVRSVETDPTQAGHWLDLAVRLCQKGQGLLTQEVLHYIEQTFGPPAGIMEVIGLIRQSGCETPLRSEELNASPRISLSAQRGRDSNVNQGASSALFALGTAFPGVVVELTPEFLPIGDQFTALDAGLTLGLGADLQGVAQVRIKHHDRQHHFDTGIALSALEKSWSCGRGRCTASGALAAISLGARLYQTLGQIQVSWTVPMIDTALPQAMTLEASLGRQLFSTQPSFNAWLAQTRASWRVLLGGTDLLQLSLAVGIDEPTAGRPGGSRRGVTLGASGSHELGRQLMLDWSAQQQITHDASAYSPGLIDAARRPILQSVVVGLARPVAEFQRVRLEFRHTSHRDVVPLFTYRNTGVSIAWLWDFSL